ncbi:MAG: acyl-CoA acyltransferase [Roseiarcus sp.]
MTSSGTGVRLRQIAASDLPAIARLLSEGFPNRTVSYWLRGLDRHARRPPPDGYPPYGFLLDHDGAPVGVILLLFARVGTGEGAVVRCNLSSWYVKPAFRAFGSLLITSTTRDPSVTYFNITPAPHTWSTVEAQRFVMYCRGQMYGAVALRRAVSEARAEVFVDSVPGLSPFEHALLREHAGFGCLSVVVRSGSGIFPFAFQKHWVRGVVPVFRLIYCRDITEFDAYAGNLGRLLLLRGGLLVRWDANAPAAGVVGWYTERRGRKYAKGNSPPRLGDLAFTEAALFDS